MTLHLHPPAVLPEPLALERLLDLVRQIQTHRPLQPGVAQHARFLKASGSSSQEPAPLPEAGVAAAAVPTGRIPQPEAGLAEASRSEVLEGV